MEAAFIKKVYKSIEYKRQKLDNKFINYFLRAAAAGMLLTLTYAFVGQLTHDYVSSGSSLGLALGKTLTAYLFGIGLIFIIYLGAELFTSNAMYFAIGLYHKRVKSTKAVKVLTYCWIFNLIGSVFCAFLLAQTGLFTQPEGQSHYLFELAAKKSNLPVMQVLFRGILANWVVNIVVYTASVVKDDVAKLLVIPFGLMPFVYLGFEHSIANFGVFLLTIFTPGGLEAAVYHGHAFTYMGMINNLLFATIGNLIGGGILVAGYLAYLNRNENNNI